ncbi:MAG: 30S ribosomal protein S13 [Bacteroidota bacterium]
MARVLGVDIPDNKRGEIALTYIFGIGRSLSKQIHEAAQVDKDKHPVDWTDEESKRIRAAIGEHYKVEGALRTEIRLNIKRLMDIGSHRGKRHRMGLPVRGQKTKNNARTRKGKRKTVAGKKKAPK